MSERVVLFGCGDVGSDILVGVLSGEMTNGDAMDEQKKSGKEEEKKLILSTELDYEFDYLTKSNEILS